MLGNGEVEGAHSNAKFADNDEVAVNRQSKVKILEPMSKSKWADSTLLMLAYFFHGMTAKCAH